MVTDVTYELIEIAKDLDEHMMEYDYPENPVTTTYTSLERIITEMVESDSQFRFKKGIFDRQYGLNVEYASCGEVVIRVKDGRDLVTVMDIEDFLNILSFRIYKGIEKAKEEHKNWKLWKLTKMRLEDMGITY